MKSETMQDSDESSISQEEGNKGITFSGVKFTVPSTSDVIETLFDPMVSKSNSELLVLAILASNGVIYYLVPSNSAKIKTFTLLYCFWRLCYNFGIGYLLRSQSNLNKIVNWARKLRIFDRDNGSLIAQFARAEIISQRGESYKIDRYPYDFNTWLLFRKVVDLILMLDFTTFVCLFVACAFSDNYQFLTLQCGLLTFVRLLVGAALILFNLWVKVNAHNTIKDYAWYWGDFFFRQINNEELIFDGVFEMVPHPMYSVGYIGYYGFALIAKSYTVLVVAIFGHFLQMIFLHYIENPHIDKLYGPSPYEVNWLNLLKLKDLQNFDNLKPLVGLYNFNFLRALDSINLILVGTYALLLPLCLSLSGGTVSPKVLFILTVCIKMVELFSINGMLLVQSNFKFFTKWYLSMDIPVSKSLNNWAVFYNSMINLSHASLFGMNLYRYIHHGTLFEIVLFKNYSSLRMFLGLTLIITQIWVNASIIDLIGYFGWFFGDFFIPRSQRHSVHLTKAGVYRYLNNPEQFFGVCGVMGLFLAVSLRENLICAIVWFTGNFIRINFIEKPHMIKIYGEQEVGKDLGVTKTFKRHLIPDVMQRKLQQEIDSTDRKRCGSLVESMESFIRDFRAARKQPNETILYASFEKSDHTIIIHGLDEDKLVQADKMDLKLPKFAYAGIPLTVKWLSPIDSHSQEDWIGLYKVQHTLYSRSRSVTSSQGRWIWCDSAEGSYQFSKMKLPWKEGVYEFRYHLAGTHDVAYISDPFEIKIRHISVPTSMEDSPGFENSLKSYYFDPWIDIETVHLPISQCLSTQVDPFTTYEILSSIISVATDIKISTKTFFSNNECLTISRLSQKLVGYRKVLDELENGGADLLINKKIT